MGYDAVFMKLDEKGIRNLKPLDAYVAYGYVNHKLVNELLHRRAYTDVDGGRRPLNDNRAIEKAFGKYDILCLSDLANLHSGFALQGCVVSSSNVQVGFTSWASR